MLIMQCVYLKYTDRLLQNPFAVDNKTTSANLDGGMNLTFYSHDIGFS